MEQSLYKLYYTNYRRIRMNDDNDNNSYYIDGDEATQERVHRCRR